MFRGFLRTMDYKRTENCTGKMKKGMVLVAVLLMAATLLSACAYGAPYFAVPGFCFRRTTWKMDRDTVQLTEEREPDEVYENEIVYQSEFVYRFYADLYYAFEGDTLASATYLFRYILNHPIMDDFNILRRALVDFYGAPVEDNTAFFGTGGSFEISNDNIAAGRVRRVCVWQDGYSKISLSLKGIDGTVYFSLSYQPIISNNT